MGNHSSRPVPLLPTTVGGRWADRRFTFENLVLEGGGAKSIAYIGVCKVLEDAGILPQIKRFAGTSAGAITLDTVTCNPTERQAERANINININWHSITLWQFPAGYANRKHFSILSQLKYYSRVG
ncbi:Hypp4081 [Branchiostoma lanceolatum]|nr:Hypp4081 [Branchiostoma lanceolatum]